MCVAARRLGRPVKWIEDRVENLLAAGHARDDVLDVEAAVTVDGTILGVRVHMTVDQGAYQLVTLPSTSYPTLVRVLFPNAYRIRDYSFETTVVATEQGDVRRVPRPVGDRRRGRASACSTSSPPSSGSIRSRSGCATCYAPDELPDQDGDRARRWPS